MELSNLTNGICVSKCGVGNYYDKLTEYCLQCNTSIEHCSVCKPDGSICLECEDGYNAVNDEINEGNYC